MKVLVISPGTLPITVDHGGAIQNLLKIYLDYNETKDDKVVVYSVKLSNKMTDTNTYKNTEFRCVDKSSCISKIKIICNKLLKKIKPNNSNYYIKTVVKDLKKNDDIGNYDLIIFENGIEYIPYFKSEFANIPKIALHLHNDYLNINTKNAYNIVNMIDEVWCVSEFLKSRVLDITTDKDKVKCLYNSILDSRFSKDINVIDERNKLGIKADDFVYIYVGRLFPEKGLTELITAFNRLRIRKAKLIIIGSGKKILKKKDNYISSIKKMVNDNVIFLGQVNNKSIYKYYKLSDIQVIPSICNEAFGLIALEGICCGLPCITTGSGGLKEIYAENAVYVNKNNLIKELEEKMEWVYDNQDSLNKYTQGYGSIKSKYSLNKYTEQFYNLIHKVD